MLLNLLELGLELCMREMNDLDFIIKGKCISLNCLETVL